MGKKKLFKGTVIFLAGDTPASANAGGFRETPSAYRLCRSCMTTEDDWKISGVERYYTLRSKTAHEDHITAACDPTITKEASNYWKKYYGVNRRSSLMDIIDVTEDLPQDMMHILIEGPLHILIRLLLRYLLNHY